MEVKQEYLDLLEKYNLKYVTDNNDYISMQELFAQVVDRFYDIPNDDRNVIINNCPFKRK